MMQLNDDVNLNDHHLMVASNTIAITYNSK